MLFEGVGNQANVIDTLDIVEAVEWLESIEIDEDLRARRSVIWRRCAA